VLLVLRRSLRCLAGKVCFISNVRQKGILQGNGKPRVKIRRMVKKGRRISEIGRRSSHVLAWDGTHEIKKLLANN